MLNIFNLKKNLSKLNVLEKKGEVANKARHYPPATKEWFNSIYAYNKNTLKRLPSADIYLINILRSFFNMYSRKLEKNIRARRLRMWQRRLSVNRILVGKPELKHTSEKIVINVFVYNKQKAYYLKRMANLITIKYTAKFKTLPEMVKALDLSSLKIRKCLPKPLLGLLNKNPSYFNLKMLVIRSKGLALLNKIKEEKNLLLTKLNFNKNIENTFNYENKYYIQFLKKLLKKERLFMRLRQIMFLNESKFNDIFLINFLHGLSKVYNKDVIINIVSLKSHHLNSEIFTNLLGIRIRNRKNRVLRVIKASLKNITLPFYSRLDYFSKVPKITSLQNLWLKDLMTASLLKKNKDNNTDILNNVLFSNLTALDNIKKEIIKDKDFSKGMFYRSSQSNTALQSNTKVKSIFRFDEKEYILLQSVLNTIKHKTVSGIRIEASGRVSKRIIAARSVFKLRLIGTIRNIDSSYKGLPSVILRGNLKTNIQFSKNKNKTRIGAFGLKGWIGSV